MVLPDNGDATGFSSQLPMNNEGRLSLKRPGISAENMSALTIPTRYPSNAPSNIYFKTQLCLRFKNGQCRHAETCKYAHGREDLRQIPRIRKELSNDDHGNWDGNDDQNVFPNKSWGKSVGESSASRISMSDSKSVGSFYYKTRLCDFYQGPGFCALGENCSYAHGPAELQRPGQRDEAKTSIPVSIPTNHNVRIPSNILPSNNMANAVESMNNASEKRRWLRQQGLHKLNGIYGDWIGDLPPEN